MPTPLPLHQIDADLAVIEAAFLDADGETDDETNTHYDALLAARQDKHAACLALVRRNAATANAYRAEADRLALLAHAHAATVERVKRILLASMLARGERRVETPIGRVAVQESSTRAIVLRDGDAGTLPERFRVVTVAADKRALAEALRADDPEALAVAAFTPPTPFLRLT